MVLSYSVFLLLFAGASYSYVSATAMWDQPTDITTEILKSGPVQAAPTNMMVDASIVKFKPPSWNVKNQATCVPRWEQVEITNAGDKELIIEAVSSDHGMFHPSLSKPETLQKGEVTKMQILFLAQSVGSYEGLIFVQTNLGSVVFPVKATTVENPYKVESIIGAKVVVGERFSPPVSIYNPRDTNLHVREVFTTEGFLHLALPDKNGGGQLESGGQSIGRETSDAPATEASDGSAGVWTVLPKQQKTVIHVSFVSHVTGKFQGFVRLRTDAEDLLVPVEITVTKGGVHVMPEVVDFQTLVSPAQSKSMWLTLSNFNPQPIELLSLYDPKQDRNLHITGFDHKGIQVTPGGSVRFAKVTYSGGEEGHMQGKLQLILNDTDSVSATLDIPYKARVLYGSLGFMNDKTKFQSLPGKVMTTMRSIMISNNFSVPILILNAKIDDPSFQISHFVPNTLLMPRDAVSLMHVEFTSNGTSALYTRDLELSTNVTAMKIPLQVYHGNLHCQVEHGALQECSSSDLNLDMGIISVTETRRKLINITNLNPVNVTVESITFTHASVNLYMEGVYGSKQELVRGPRPVPRNLQSSRILTLPPHHRLALAIEVVASEAGQTSASITISTRRKENIILKVQYESVLGSLAFLPPTIRFEASFPGRVQSRTIAARSTFERPLHIQAVRSTDSRIIPELITRSLNPLARTEVAHIHYDPSKFSSPEDNYMPQSDEVDWDLPLTEEVVERWTKRQKMWSDLGKNGQSDIEATLLFDTNIVRGAPLTIRAFLTKPTIVREAALSYELTQVGTSVTQMLLIYNPSDTILAVQLVLFPHCDLMNEGNSTCDVGFKLTSEAAQVFHVKPHAELPVGPIVFEPQQHSTYNTTLYVRNNLTMLYPVRLNGIGGSGRLVFSNGALDFNLSVADLVEEPLDESTASRPRASISKSFTATNDCELPVEVVHMDISGVSGCSGFGFHIHDCHPFIVAPHENVSFKVSFSPDFPASRWEQRLRLHTQSGILSVPMRAFVPTELLPQLANRSPLLGDSEASVKKAITIVAVVVCAAMLVVVVGDCMKVYRATLPDGEMCQKGRPSEMISLLSWPSVNTLAPSSMWSGNIRREHLLGQRIARRAREEAPETGPRNEVGEQPEKRGNKQNQQNQGKSAQHDDEHRSAQSYSAEAPQNGQASSTAPKDEAKVRAEEAERIAAEEAERRIREEERRQAREAAEEDERQAKAVTDEVRKADERRREERDVKQSQAQSQTSAPTPKAESKGKKKNDKKDTTAPTQKDPPRDDAKPKAGNDKAGKAEREKNLREEREKQAREERERQERERQERENRERQERERHAREEQEREREKQAREERHQREERERHARDERERREEHSNMHDVSEWQHSDRSQRENRKNCGQSTDQHNNDRKGIEPSGKGRKGKEGPNRKEPPPAKNQGKSKAGNEQGHRNSGHGPLQGSVWADPGKPSYFPQSQWAHPDIAAAAALANAGVNGTGNFSPELLAAIAGGDSGSTPNPKPSLPPPPSMPPPPAPRVKGGSTKPEASMAVPKHHQSKQTHMQIPGNTPTLDLPPRQMTHGVPPAVSHMVGTDFVPRPDRSNIPLVAPIGPNPMKMQGRPPPPPPVTQRPAASLLPDQEFIPINTASPSLDRMQVFGDSPFTSSLFDSPFSGFIPVNGYGGESPGGGSSTGLLADLHADSTPVVKAPGRRQSD